MAYSKTTWVTGDVVTATKLNHAEDGIATAQSTAEGAAASVAALGANGAIGTANLAPAAVTNAKIDQAAVDSDNIRTGAIITPLIYDGAVTLPKLGADVTAELDNKADIDGSYESMTVGNAEQLVSSVGITDQTPYNFRTSGGSTEIGDREELNAVVGATVAWKQLVQNGNFNGNTTNWTTSGSATRTVSNNVLTITSSAINSIQQTLPLANANGHKILFCGTVSATKSANFGIYKNSSGTYALPINPTDGTKVRMEKIIPLSATSTDVFDIRFRANTADSTTITAENVNVFDLTALLGSTIADYIYALEQSNAGAGVAYFRKLFPKPYYAYNSGELLSVQTNAHRMVGFNQWDEESESGYYDIGNNGAKASSTNWARCKNPIPCVPNTTYYFYTNYAGSDNFGALVYYDASGNQIGYKTSGVKNNTFTTPNNCYYMTFYAKPSWFNSNICINLSWDGERNGEFEPYEAHEYALDDITLRGILKLDANNNLYADGDRYLPDGTVERRYGIVTFNGTESWTVGGVASTGFYTEVSDVFRAYDYSARIRCNRFTAYTNQQSDSFKNADEGITGYYSGGALSSNWIYLKVGSGVTTAAELKTWLSTNPITVVYELTAQTTESADPYQQTQIVDDFGTEEFVDAAFEAGERDVAIPVGNETVYKPNLRAKLEMAPDSPDGDGDYIVRQTNGQNAYIPLVEVKELPDFPSSDGSYKLRCTVASGTATLSWVSDS